MRAKVTTEIDINLKMMFEACKDKHGKSYKEVLEAGIIQVIKLYDPIAALSAEIERLGREQDEKRQQLAQLKLLESSPTRIVEYEDEAKVRQAAIIEWFQKDPEHIMDGIDKGWLNYKKLAEKFGFNSQAEFRQCLKQVVKSWKAEHEHRAVS